MKDPRIFIVEHYLKTNEGMVNNDSNIRSKCARNGN